MEKNYFLIIVLFLTSIVSFSQSQNPFISEIHYDNCGDYILCLGDDANEGIEITGTPGFDLTGWEFVFYEGREGKVYKTETLSGTIPANGVLWTPISNLNDGSITIFGREYLFSAAVALVNTNKDPDEVTEFLSYEGSFTAIDGPAAGMTSEDIGVFENYDTDKGLSLQKTDAGWVGPIAATPGESNTDLTLNVDKDILASFKMYPNPVSNGTLNVSFQNNSDKEIEIYSLIGNKVLSKKMSSKGSIDVSNLSTGFYMVRIEEEGKIATRKLVVK